MSSAEITFPADSEPIEQSEFLHPGHFYAAYILDQAETRQEDIRTILEQSQNLGYPLRYWWLSDAMDLQGFPDRLIVCVHIPSRSEDAGLDFYNALKQEEVSWDDLEAAMMDEYQVFGKHVQELEDFRLPSGDLLFPSTSHSGENMIQKDHLETVFLITQGDVREHAEETIGRGLTDEEFNALLIQFDKALEWLDWRAFLDEAIQRCRLTSSVGPSSEENRTEVDSDS